ncbi:restriction endonuclease subunit S [Escherichia coli]|uniref:restriction endonuclease subunit S n=1 Tax=Escherichia coli TaxID=562 RepID=UPI00292A9074|nr:restriction endonuclease subunit S [Escherichia coli]MDV1834596.1 restriction endonuclease subunit S [Escherichia coli]
MSALSYLEKLLDGVEVEWKTLGSIAELKRGTSITKKDVIDGTIPVVAGGRTPAYYHNTSNRDGQTIVIAGSGAYAGFVSWWEEPIFVSDAFTVKPHNILLPRYCYHFLMNMQQQLHEFKSGGGVPHVYPRDVSPILIPIPCPDTPEKSLAIQSEIVRILDKFTALTAELTAELNMRKKQYNYYRDQLLSFKEGEVKWKTLGEITEINTGQKPSEILDKAATFDYINAGTSRSGYTTMSNCDGDTVTTPSRGQGGIGFVGYQKTPFWLGPLCYKIKSLNNEILINKFLFYTLQSRNRILLSLKKEGGVPAVNKIDLAKLIIPLPSLDEQKRIVSLLDKFDTLTNSITEGLPREIELRQKQYEYYRDLLFSFPKPETVSN